MHAIKDFEASELVFIVIRWCINSICTNFLLEAFFGAHLGARMSFEILIRVFYVMLEPLRLNLNPNLYASL